MIRIERRKTPAEGPLVTTMLMAAATLGALVIGALLFLPLGIDPLEAYGQLFGIGFGSLRGLGNTMSKAAPLILVSLATICAWRTGFFFLGYEGCLLVGAAATAWVALAATEGGALGPLPFAAFLPLAMVATLVSGGVWAGLVAWFKTRFSGNEVIVSLMMNYIAIFLVQYLVAGPMRAPGDLPQTERFARETWMPALIDGTRLNAGLLVALVAACIVWVLLWRNRLGYELIVTGLNPRAAQYAGIPVRRRQVLAAFLAGGLAALAGMVQILGVQHRLIDGMSAEAIGFIGIVTALLGRLHPAGAVVASILFAAMAVGADAMQRRLGMPTSLVLTIQSLIVLFILGSDILRRYRLVRASGASDLVPEEAQK